MNSPYDVLGVSPSSTDEEIKNAYRELAKKYHPDNYADSPLSEFADEKMSEINTAYDQIMNTRRGQTYNGQQNASSTQQQYNTRSNFSDIRALIQANRLVDAEELLDGIPIANRDAEWYFLKGCVFYSRGWLEDAANHFTSACRMDPNNAEYRAALNRMGWQRQGNMGGYGQQGQYRQPARNSGGCSACDMCTGLLCADCCCECMGGDLISCC